MIEYKDKMENLVKLLKIYREIPEETKEETYNNIIEIAEGIYNSLVKDENEWEELHKQGNRFDEIMVNAMESIKPSIDCILEKQSIEEKNEELKLLKEYIKSTVEPSFEDIMNGENERENQRISMMSNMIINAIYNSIDCIIIEKNTVNEKNENLTSLKEYIESIIKTHK